MALGRCWRRRQARTGPGGSPVRPLPTRYQVRDIRVPDDGLSLTGRRYGGYHREVARRQEAGIEQDVVSIWIDQEGCAYVQGTPRINEVGELEVLEGDKLIGTVRNTDGAFYFYPE